MGGHIVARGNAAGETARSAVNPSPMIMGVNGVERAGWPMAELAQLARTMRGVRRARGVLHPSTATWLSSATATGTTPIADWLHRGAENSTSRRGWSASSPSMARSLGGWRPSSATGRSWPPHDLAEEIEEAIAGSRFLIVLCSRPPPSRAGSTGDRLLQAASRRGSDPGRDRRRRAAAQRHSRPRRGVFPAFAAGPFRQPRADRPPSAPSLLPPTCARGRRAADGLLKLAAGMLGVGLDDLAQREAQRRTRRLYAITAASVSAATSGAKPRD